MQIRQVALNEMRVASRGLLQVRNGEVRLLPAACCNVDIGVVRQECFGGFFSNAYFDVGISMMRRWTAHLYWRLL